MNITEKPKYKLQVIFEEKGVEGIRFFSMGSACCGPQIDLSLDAQRKMILSKKWMASSSISF